MAMAAEPDDSARVFKAVGASVVTVKALGADGGAESQGSGVVVRNGVVATNCHVVRYATSLRVVSATAELPAEWIGQHPTQDLCVLSVDGLSLPRVRVRASSTLSVGEPVFAIGNPLGFGISISTGLLATAANVRGYTVVIGTAVQSPGSSGGGLFDQSGQLIGINTAVLGVGQRLTLSLSADGLDDLFSNPNPPPAKATVPNPETPWGRIADDLKKGAEWTALEKHASAWHEAQPNAAAALVYLAMAQVQSNRFGEAESSLRLSLSLDGDSAFAWRQLALVLQAVGREAEGDQALDEADRRQPNDAESYWLRADWNRKRGRLDEAQRQVAESIRRDPSHPVAWRVLGTIESARKNGSAATSAFAVARRLEEYDSKVARANAESASRTATDNRPAQSQGAIVSARSEQATTLYAVGIAEHENGRLGSAEDALRASLELTPDRAEAWNTLGIVLMKTGRVVDAEAAYDRAISLAPANADYLVNRAGLRRSTHRLGPAIEDARRATELAPAKARAWSEYGAAELEAGDFRGACTAFGHLSDSDHTADTLVSFGECLAATGQKDAAMSKLRTAEAREPRLVRIQLGMAKVLGGAGNYEQALDHEERALALDPTNVAAWSGKGYSLLKLGRFDDAVTTLESAVRLAPDSANATINLGEAQMRSRNIGQAIVTLQRAITLAPQAADARLLLAQAFLAVPLPAKSREQIDAVLERQPKLPSALALLTLSYLIERNDSAASDAYIRFRNAAPDAARAMRSQAIRGGLGAASALPE